MKKNDGGGSVVRSQGFLSGIAVISLFRRILYKSLQLWE